MNIEPLEHGVKVQAFDGAVPFYLKSFSAASEPHHPLRSRHQAGHA